jgi:hypothetical protein
MKIRKLLITVALVATPLLAAPAQAFDSWEERDAYYEACKEAFISRGMGDDNLASQYCYPLAYGSETSGGGTPDPYPLPVPGTPCYGSCGFN